MKSSSVAARVKEGVETDCKGAQRNSGGRERSSMIVVVVTQLYTFVKTHQFVQLKSMDFTLSK